MSTQPDQLDGVELASCPWCGNAAELVPTGAWNLCRAGYCQHCEIEGPTRATEAGAIEAWNARSLTQPLTQSVALARDAARYRWLRKGTRNDLVVNIHWDTNDYLLRGIRLDEAVDAALAEEKSRG